MDGAVTPTASATARMDTARRSAVWERRASVASRISSRSLSPSPRRERGRLTLGLVISATPACCPCRILLRAPPRGSSRRVLPARLPSPGLPPGGQIVIRMHYLEGMTLPEIAGALSAPIGTIKSRLAYGLAALRRAL
ncbi:MAG: sigma-70 family RNA polymerase sigma factor, partial [Actinobacteria bacterium ATB1]|nr:sigma-70 family RNA polymerase sigma factor [Actinobacteria bacterium ATB1]